MTCNKVDEGRAILQPLRKFLKLIARDIKGADGQIKELLGQRRQLIKRYHDFPEFWESTNGFGPGTN